MRYRLFFILAALTMLAGLLFQATGCSTKNDVSITEPVSSPGTTTQKVTVTDASGRQIDIILPVQRICYIGPAIAEGLRIVDAWDRVVAKDSYTFDNLIFPNLESLPELPYSDTGLLNYEQIIELKPDVLLVLPAAGNLNLEETIDRLEPEIPVVSVFDTADPETWTRGIELMGKILQKENEAREFTAFVQGIEDKIIARKGAMEDPAKRRFFMKVSGWTIDQFSSFSNQFAPVKKLSGITGSTNIAAELPSMSGWVQDIDPEWLMSEQFDYVLVDIWSSYYPGAMGIGVKDTRLAQAVHENLSNLDIFAESKAITSGNLFLMDHELIMSIRYPILLAYSVKALQPDLFSDMNPRGLMQEYLTRFIRIDIDLDKSGVFFYPEK